MPGSPRNTSDCECTCCSSANILTKPPFLKAAVSFRLETNKSPSFSQFEGIRGMEAPVEAFGAPANENVLERLALLREGQAKLRQVSPGLRAPSSHYRRAHTQPSPPGCRSGRVAAQAGAWRGQRQRAGRQRRTSSGAHGHAHTASAHSALSARWLCRRCAWTKCGRRLKRQSAKRESPPGYCNPACARPCASVIPCSAVPGERRGGGGALGLCLHVRKVLWIS
jgi:hypothetical protein